MSDRDYQTFSKEIDVAVVLFVVMVLSYYFSSDPSHFEIILEKKKSLDIDFFFPLGFYKGRAFEILYTEEGSM